MSAAAGSVVVDLSVSLDGYITGPDDDRRQPLARGGKVLHSWLWDADGRMRTDGPTFPTQGGSRATIGAMLRIAK